VVAWSSFNEKLCCQFMHANFEPNYYEIKCFDTGIFGIKN
jgi:hypothetical protein